MKLLIKDYINDPGAASEEVDIKHKDVHVKIGVQVFRITEERGHLLIMGIHPTRFRVYPEAGNAIRIESF